MKKLLGLIFLGVVFVAVSTAQNREILFGSGTFEKVKASSITWKDVFGIRKDDPSVYILMARGWLRAPISKNLKDLIKEWMEHHPKAEAVLVYSMEESSAFPDSKMKTVWVTDGVENLNLYLVRNGACPAGTMLLDPGDKTPLSKEEYEAFASKFWEAQKVAKLEKLGIWSETTPDKKI